MKQHCKYHPGTPALWYCPTDGVYFCQQCAAAEDSTLLAGRCLHCNGELDYPVAQQEPYWLALEQGLLQALRQGWPVLLGLSLLGAFLPVSWLGLLFALLLLLPVMVLVGAMLDNRGTAAVAAHEVLQQSRFWQSSVLLWAPMAICWLILAGLALWSPVAVVLLAVLGSVLLPALLLALLVEPVASRAAARWPLYVKSAPSDYGQWCGLLLLLAAALTVAGWLAVDILPASLFWMPTLPLVAIWCLALGAGGQPLLLRYGRQWGRPLRIVAPVTESLEQRRLKVQLMAGRFDKVLLALAQRVKKSGASLADWRLYDQLLAAQGQMQTRVQQAEPYLALLAEAGAWSEVAGHLRWLQQQQPHWLPSSPLLRSQLAAGLAEQAPRMAVALLKDLHQQHRDFSGLGDAYLLLARVLAEQFSLPDKAEHYLRFIEQTVPDRQLREQVQTLRQQWSA